MQDVDLAAIIAGLEATGLSRPEIASQAKLSRNTVHRAAVGDIRQPSFATVQRLVNIFDRRVRPLERK